MTKILIEIVWCLILAFCGYIATIYYLHDIKWNEKNLSIIKVNSKNRLFYLVCAVSTSIGMSIVFCTIYSSNTLLDQVKLLTLIMLLLPMSVIDYKTHKIPNKFILTALVLRIICYCFEFIVSPIEAWITMKENLIGAVIIGGFFLIILLVFKNSIGMGDIKLFAVMGLYQGLWGVINSVFFSLVASFFLSVFLLLSKKKKRKDVIPFGPCIFVGTIVAIGLSGI